MAITPTKFPKAPKTAKPKAAKLVPLKFIEEAQPAAPDPAVLPAADPAAPSLVTETPAPVADEPRFPAHVEGWQPVSITTLIPGKLYTGFVGGQQIDVLYSAGSFFTDNGGSFSMRVAGVTHVRERVADPI